MELTPEQQVRLAIVQSLLATPSGGSADTATFKMIANSYVKYVIGETN